MITSSHPRRALTALGLAALLALTACGGGGDDDKAETTTTTAAETTTTTEAATTTTEDTAVADAEELAERINLTIDDFASGWVAEDDDEGGSDEDGINACFTDADLDAALADVETPSFSAESPDGSSAQNVNMQTLVFASVEEAETVMGEAATNRFAGCIKDVFLEFLGGDGEVELTPQADEPPLTEESLGVVGAISVPLDDGTTVPGLIDLHLFRTAEVVSFTATVDLGDSGAFEDTLGGLYQAIASRHAAEIG